MRLLIAGGCGYIGSHTARACVAAGHQVWVYDNLSTGHREAIRGLNLIVGELGDHKLLTATLHEHRIEAVLHFAAVTSVGDSVRDPAAYYANNLCHTRGLLDAMRVAGTEALVFSGTAAVYGQPRQSPISESAPCQPESPYGRSKLAAEWLLQDYAQAYGLRYAILRYFNAAGAAVESDLGEDHSPETHLIPLVLQTALGIRPAVNVFGGDYPTADGTCIRDYVHVDDLASAHLAAVEQLSLKPQLVCNLGTGRGYSVREVLSAAREVTGRPIPHEIRAPRAGDVAELVAESSRAVRELGWQPRWSDLGTILETAWRWHSRHPQGYATV